jgi:hypothetical protein
MKNRCATVISLILEKLTILKELKNIKKYKSGECGNKIVYNLVISTMRVIRHLKNNQCLFDGSLLETHYVLDEKDNTEVTSSIDDFFSNLLLFIDKIFTMYKYDILMTTKGMNNFYRIAKKYNKNRTEDCSFAIIDLFTQFKIMDRCLFITLLPNYE